MTVGISANNSTVMAGLNTGSFTVVNPGPYTVGFVSTLPYKASGSPGGSEVTTGGSGLSVVINLNGAPVLSVTAPSPTQPSTSGRIVIACVADDVITVVTSSSDADDAGLNAVKTTINLYQGVE